VYANAVTGRAGLTPELGPDLQPLFEAILRKIPAPKVDAGAPLQMLVTSLGYDEYRGVTAVGRIFAGAMQAGQAVARMTLAGETIPERARYLYVHKGLERVEVDSAQAGEIVVIAGLEEIAIGETLGDPENPLPLPVIQVEEPTVRMTFGVNTSPFAGREGRWGTSRKIRERLYEELRRNVALRVADTDSADTFLVSGRGELHLAILIETMRREGYEFMVSRPEVIFRRGEGDEVLEPFEEVYIETSAESVGVVVEMLGSRRGQDAGFGREPRYQRAFDLYRAHARPIRFPLPVPDRHARHGRDAHHLPRLPAYGGQFGAKIFRLAGLLGSGRNHHLRPEKCRRKGHAFRRPGCGGLPGYGGR
jgi:GTP-binding protein